MDILLFAVNQEYSIPGLLFVIKEEDAASATSNLLSANTVLTVKHSFNICKTNLPS